ncbi:50S ribosomal protein L11 methyltransferase [Prolixibacteraceae bacterium JC049]|nr:50S ribosomal protein L11 methyltransferase [Prolixibacteraceae bacterium JC049]
MKYTKVTFEISPCNELHREIVTAELGTLPFDSFIDLDNGLEAFIPTESYQSEELSTLFIFQNPLFSISYNAEEMPDVNWNEEWEKNYFKPLVIADKCVIRAPFHTEYPASEYEIIIEPKMAFGTGNHETTSLVMEHILQMDVEGHNVLDMGCGTGILGILTAMRGAHEVTAIDIDEWPWESTLENAQLNNIINLKAYQGDASLLVDQQFDTILANIHKNVLINDMATYNKVLKTGGSIVFSGFYTEDKEDIKAKAESLGLTDAGFITRNNWVAYRFTK